MTKKKNGGQGQSKRQKQSHFTAGLLDKGLYISRNLSPIEFSPTIIKPSHVFEQLNLFKGRDVEALDKRNEFNKGHYDNSISETDGDGLEAKYIKSSSAFVLQTPKLSQEELDAMDSLDRFSSLTAPAMSKRFLYSTQKRGSAISSKPRPRGVHLIEFPISDSEKREMYEGEAKAGKPHGKGKMLFRDGSVFVGSFVDGEMDGVGSFADEFTGVRYVGQWSQSRANGFGRISYKLEAATTFPKYSNNVFSKLHTETFNSFLSPGPAYLEEYSGGFVDGVISGVGFGTYTNGVKYEGDWVHNKRHGRGAMTFICGDVFEGSFEMEERSGNGVYRLKMSDETFVDMNFTYSKNFPRPIYSLSVLIFIAFVSYGVYQDLASFYLWFDSEMPAKEAISSSLSISEVARLLMDKYLRNFSIIRGIFFVVFRRQVLLISCEMVETLSLMLVQKFSLPGFEMLIWWFGCLIGAFLNFAAVFLVWFG